MTTTAAIYTLNLTESDRARLRDALWAAAQYSLGCVDTAETNELRETLEWFEALTLRAAGARPHCYEGLQLSPREGELLPEFLPNDDRPGGGTRRVEWIKAYRTLNGAGLFEARERGDEVADASSLCAKPASAPVSQPAALNASERTLAERLYLQSSSMYLEADTLRQVAKAAVMAARIFSEEAGS